MSTSRELPLVSIIMPTFNRRVRLAHAVASVLGQTHDRTELVVINDAGEDVEDVIASVDPTGRVTYLRLPQKRGPAGARNLGLAVARGDYLGFLDDDDELDPHHVASLVAELERGEHEMVYAGARRIVQEDRGDEVVTLGVEDPCAVWAKQHHPDELLVHNPIPIMSPLFSRRVYEEIGGFDDTLPVLEDWEFWIRMTRRFSMKHVPVVSSTVSARPDGITHTRRRDFYTCAQRIFQRYREDSQRRQDVLEAQARLIDGHRRHEKQPPGVSVIVAAQPGQHPESFDACITAILERTRGVVFELLVAAPFAPLRDYEAPQLNWHHTEREEPPVTAVEALTEIAIAPYVAVVDARATVRLGWLHPLVERARAGAVAVAGQSIGRDGRLVHVGLEVGQGGKRMRYPFLGAPAHQGLSVVTGLDAVAGGAVLFDRVAWRKAGGFSASANLGMALAKLSFTVDGPVAFAPRSQCSLPTAPELDDTELLSTYRALHEESDREVEGARCLAREGRPDEAEAILARRCATAPRDGNAWLVRGLIASFQQRQEEAARYLIEARRWGAERFATTVGELMVMVAQGRHEEAFPLALTELERYPMEKEPLHFLYASGLALGRFDEVAEPIERYLELHPGDAHQRFALASLYLQSGELLRASTHAGRLAETAPDYADLPLLEEKIAAAAPQRRASSSSTAAAAE